MAWADLCWGLSPVACEDKDVQQQTVGNMDMTRGILMQKEPVYSLSRIHTHAYITILTCSSMWMKILLSAICCFCLHLQSAESKVSVRSSDKMVIVDLEEMTNHDLAITPVGW